MGEDVGASKDQLSSKDENESMLIQQKVRVMLSEYQQLQTQGTMMLGFQFRWALTYGTALFVAIGWFMGMALNTQPGSLPFWTKVQNSQTLQFLVLAGTIINASFALLVPLFVLNLGYLSRYISTKISIPLSKLFNTKVISCMAEISTSNPIQIPLISSMFLWYIMPVAFSFYVLFAFRQKIYMNSAIHNFYLLAVIYDTVSVILAVFMLGMNARLNRCAKKVLDSAYNQFGGS